MSDRPSAVGRQPEALPSNCREPLRDLLIACADTKLLMGYHYGEWTFGAPTLEASVAHCSLAQGELGHVRLLHGILKAHFEVDPDYLVEQRPAAEFASVRYLDDALPCWEAVVAMSVVVDLAMTRLIASLKDSSFAPLRNSAAKLLEEERYHLHHGRGWLRTLSKDDRSKRLVGPAIVIACRDVMEWFGPPFLGEQPRPEDEALVTARLKSQTDHQILKSVLEDVSDLTEELKLSRVATEAPAFEHWTPKRRRGPAAGPSDEVLYHLRGIKNAVFKQA